MRILRIRVRKQLKEAEAEAELAAILEAAAAQVLAQADEAESEASPDLAVYLQPDTKPNKAIEPILLNPLELSILEYLGHIGDHPPKRHPSAKRRKSFRINVFGGVSSSIIKCI